MGKKNEVFRSFCSVVVVEACAFLSCVLAFFVFTAVTALLFQVMCPRVCKRFDNPAAASAYLKKYLTEKDQNSSDLFPASKRIKTWFFGGQNGEFLAVHQNFSRAACANQSNDTDRIGEISATESEQKIPQVEIHIYIKTLPISTQEAEYRELQTSTTSLPKGNIYNQALPRLIYHDHSADELKRHEEHQPEKYIDVQALPIWIYPDQLDNSTDETIRHEEYQPVKDIAVQSSPTWIYHDQPENSPDEIKRQEEYQPVKDIHAQALPTWIYPDQSDSSVGEINRREEYQAEKDIKVQALPIWIYPDQSDSSVDDINRREEPEEDILAQALPKWTDHDQPHNSMNDKKRHEEDPDMEAVNEQIRRYLRLIGWLANSSNLNTDHKNDGTMQAETTENESGMFYDKTTERPFVWGHLNDQSSSQSVQNQKDTGDLKVRTIPDGHLMATAKLQETQSDSPKASKESPYSTSTGRKSGFHRRHHKRPRNSSRTDDTDSTSTEGGNQLFVYFCLGVLSGLSLVLLVITCFIINGRKRKMPTGRLPLVAQPQNLN